MECDCRLAESPHHKPGEITTSAMLCAIRQSDKLTVTAFSQAKSNAPFVCPVCRGTVIQRRGTEPYSRRGIFLRWLAQWDPSLDSGRYSSSVWERWLHAAYLGRIYYWKEGLTVIPYHMAPYSTYVEESSWYSSSGDEMSAGGYE